MFNVHHIFQIHWIWGEVLRTMQQAGDTLQVVRLDRIGVTLEEENKAFVKMTVTPLRDNCGMGYIFMGEDITGRLVLEHELAQAQKLESIGQLAAGIAHELNTPIQFVGDNVRFLSGSCQIPLPTFTPHSHGIVRSSRPQNPDADSPRSLLKLVRQSYSRSISTFSAMKLPRFLHRQPRGSTGWRPLCGP
jgi:signal transduction histidine kinase